MSTNRVHTVHRAGAAGLGGFLVAFGLAGLTLGAGFLATSGPIVMGLSTNGLLSTLSLVVGVVLVGAAVRGGQVASTVSVAVGTLFLASGIVNALVLDTSLNMLAFRMANVVFSLLVGAALLFVGAYGRFTVDLPASSPYARERTRVELPVHRTDGALERAMAAAERAVALHVATVDQARRVAAASAFRTAEARRAAFSNVN
ncbi:DUF4383 domain-containing protein [Pseudonocardia sp. 73-21]|uniref:DUF4383 domain-containing protein n=1 Tax=Pseudonocardia sp. 73-21 TaxID=1895809 RepID=UPI0009646429|nr:DUF4383 domain-containing protein [Pseudonocardia sp. 73-21]OJY44084.1 MAG: hypothetical protein BGP03_07010 [Pseudonocardia sp. 73-21]